MGLPAAVHGIGHVLAGPDESGGLAPKLVAAISAGTVVAVIAGLWELLRSPGLARGLIEAAAEREVLRHRLAAHHATLGEFASRINNLEIQLRRHSAEIVQLVEGQRRKRIIERGGDE